MSSDADTKSTPITEVREFPTEALKTYHLKDIVPIIDNMVNKDARQKLRIRKAILDIVDLFLGKISTHRKFFNVDVIVDHLMKKFIKYYGLYFRDFIHKYGARLKAYYKERIEEMDDYDKQHDFFEVVGDEDDIYIPKKGEDYPLQSIIRLDDIIMDLERHIYDKFPRPFFMIVMRMGLEEGYYGNPKAEDLEDEAFSSYYNYLYRCAMET